MIYNIQLDKNDIFRIICDIVASGLTRIRGNITDLPALADWTSEMSIKKGGLEADSLELLTIAGNVNKMFHLFETGVEEYLLRYTSIGDWTEIVLKSLARNHQTLTFSTSGSTGKEKDICHQWDELVQEIRFFATVFKLSKRIISMVPCHHIYGFLFTILLPKIMNIPVVDIRAVSIGKLDNILKAHDLIVSVPVLWEYLDRSISSNNCHALEKIDGISSTAPCRIELIESLKNKGLQKITEIFGSSETSGLGYRHSPHSPFRLLPFLNHVTDRHSNDSMIEKQLPSGDKRFFNSVDYLEWVDSRRFYPVKRKDGCVQVGGINVFPEYIAQKINAHPDIKNCAVRLMNPTEGDRLKAFVVLKGNDLSLYRKNEIKQWIRKQFTGVERPVSVLFGRVLPRNEMGKLKDFQIDSEPDSFFCYQ